MQQYKLEEAKKEREVENKRSKQLLREQEEEIIREKKKIENHKDAVKRQFEENTKLKEVLRQQ